MRNLRIPHPLGWSSGYDDDEMIPDYIQRKKAEHDQLASVSDGSQVHSRPSHKRHELNDEAILQSQTIKLNFTQAADHGPNQQSSNKMLEGFDQENRKSATASRELSIVAAVLAAPNSILSSTVNAARQGRLDLDQVKLQVAGIRIELDRIIKSKHFGQFESLKGSSQEDEMVVQRKQHGKRDETTLEDDCQEYDSVDNENAEAFSPHQASILAWAYVAGITLIALFFPAAGDHWVARVAFMAFGLSVGFEIGAHRGCVRKKRELAAQFVSLRKFQHTGSDMGEGDDGADAWKRLGKGF